MTAELEPRELDGELVDDGDLVDDEDQADAPGTDVAIRAGETLAQLIKRAESLTEPQQLVAGSFIMYLAPGGALVLVVESPGREVVKQVFNRRAVRLASRMLPALFGKG